MKQVVSSALTTEEPSGKHMKIVLNTLAIIILLIGAQSVFAQLGAPHSKNPQTAYQSGYRWGVHDAKDPCKPDCRNVYIWQPGKTFYFHTKEFIQGYMKGFCSVTGPNTGMDENEASFDCTTTLKNPDEADWYVCGGTPERHGTDFRECPQPTSGYKANENSTD
jgi:hypothetical protein